MENQFRFFWFESNYYCCTHRTRRSLCMPLSCTWISNSSNNFQTISTIFRFSWPISFPLSAVSVSLCHYKKQHHAHESRRSIYCYAALVDGALREWESMFIVWITYSNIANACKIICSLYFAIVAIYFAPVSQSAGLSFIANHFPLLPQSVLPLAKYGKLVGRILIIKCLQCYSIFSGSVSHAR